MAYDDMAVNVMSMVSRGLLKAMNGDACCKSRFRSHVAAVVVGPGSESLDSCWLKGRRKTLERKCAGSARACEDLKR